MNVSGSAVLHAPRERVWAALQDPAVLVRTIPGCQQLEQVGPDTYRATVMAGVASIKGTYSGDVRLTDQAEPDSFVLRLRCRGPRHGERRRPGDPCRRRRRSDPARLRRRRRRRWRDRRGGTAHDRRCREEDRR